jgi:uncharacterized radical SAM superfamily protein
MSSRIEDTLEQIDILIVQPPRPSWALEFVNASQAPRASPAQDAQYIANLLRQRGFRPEVFNADLLDERSFHSELLCRAASARLVAFLTRAYRLPAAQRASRFLHNHFNKQLKSMVFGFLPKDFGSDSAHFDFDYFVLGPGWLRSIKSVLLELGVVAGPPRSPQPELGVYEELTGVSGSSTVVLGPSLVCSHRCHFCEHQILKGFAETNEAQKPRLLGEVLNELNLGRKAEVCSAVFLESNFLSFPHWTREFAIRVKNAFPGFKFAINSRLKDFIQAKNDGNLERLVDSGLVSVCCGVESGNNDLLARVAKQSTVEDYIEADEILRDYGLKRFYNVILGLPGETIHTVEQTLDLMRRLTPDGLQVSIATPFPGTPLYNQAKRAGWITSKELERYYYYGSVVFQAGLKEAQLLEYQKIFFNEFNKSPP